MHKSVIIPVHASDIATLPAAIASCYPAGADNVIICMDGNCEPPPFGAELIMAMGGTTFIHTEGSFPSGVCHARNLAIQHAKTGLIIPLDSDDTLLPDSVHYMAAHWQPKCFCYGGWHDIDEQGNVTEQIAPPISLFPRKSLCFATMCFHKDDWLRVGGYPVDFTVALEDMAFCCALVNAGVKPIRIDATLYERRVYSNGSSRTETAMKYWPFLTRLMRDKYPDVFA